MVFLTECEVYSLAFGEEVEAAVSLTADFCDQLS